MNKLKDSNKVYSISLSIILLAGIFFQIQLYPISFSQFAYGKDYNFRVEAGASTVLDVSSSSPQGENVLIDWNQIKGPKVDIKLTDSNKSASIGFPLQESAYEVVLVVTAVSGKAKTTDNLIFTVTGDTPPIANAGMDRNISIQEICNPQNSSSPSLTPIILDGSQSRDDNQESLKYEWSQIAGEPRINLTTPYNVTSSFELDNICNISNTVSSIFALVVTDNKNQTDDDNVVVTITPETILSLNFTVNN